MNRLTLFAAIVVVILAAAGLQGQAGRRGEVLDANTATEKDLLSVPGITPALAKAIVGRRPFLTMTEYDGLLGASLSREQRADV